MAALTAVITSVLGATVQTPAAGIAFLSFFAIYTLDHVSDRAADLETHRDRAVFCGQHRNGLLAAALTAHAGAVAIAWPFGWAKVGMGLVPLVAVTFYSLIGQVRLAGRALPRLKDVTGIKNIVVAGVLAFAPVGLPIALSPQTLSGPAWPIAAVLFGRFAVNVVVFDLRDTLGDRRNGVRTLPVVFGPRRVLRGLHWLNLGLLPATVIAAQP